MKKTLFTLACFLSVNIILAQLSISVDNKYGFKMPGSYGQLGGYGNSTTYTTSTSYESKKFCFGNGYQPGITLRYGIKNGLGADLGYAYLLGSESVTVDKNIWNNNSTTNTIKATFSRIFFGFSYVGDKKISPIFKMGMVTSFGKIISHNLSSFPSINPNPPYNTITHYSENEFKYYGGMSVGFYSAMGLAIEVFDKIKVTVCLDVIFDDYCPQKGTLTKYLVDGKDLLPDMVTYDKEVSFMKNYTETGSVNTSMPAQAPLISIPISSFGPSFGVAFVLFKPKTKDTSIE